MEILEKKLSDEFNVLKKKSMDHKRASTILGLYDQMEQQDLLIEIFRELIDNQKLVDSEVTIGLDKGPKRIRAPSREELKIELRRHMAEFDRLDAQYKLLNPRHDPNRFKDKSVDTSDLVMPIPSSTTLEDPDTRTTDEKLKELQKKIHDLELEIQLKKKQVQNVEDLINSKGSKMSKVSNLQCDYEDLNKRVQSERDTMNVLK